MDIKSKRNRMRLNPRNKRISKITGKVLFLHTSSRQFQDSSLWIQTTAHNKVYKDVDTVYKNNDICVEIM